jgi:G3E family GTPase
VGCSLANSLVDQIKTLKRRHEPEVLFVEPSEMVVTAEMRHVCAMGRRDTAFDVGPLITLVDGPNFDFLWAERPALISGQVRGADIVAIGRADDVDAKMQEMILDVLKGLAVDPFPLSSVKGEGIDRLMALIG